ncbi:hypothetical protein EUX98_g8907 [Antrodiella citrinella]|uniref:HAT C-terminal dimerisation domain-containing protein n=1 Tax=Antrodiella citrinella TaxID=2447956 RepID=A0A4S4M114_9APHY|nr:hypothetical protein EUX98_g8907 [Antrodiella citrinella]
MPQLNKRSRTASSRASSNPPSIRSSASPSPSAGTSQHQPSNVPTAQSVTDRETEALRRFNKRYDVTKLSAEDILVVQQKKWKSDVYKHFKEPVIVTQDDGTVLYKFVCNVIRPGISPSSVSRVRHDDSTSNLSRHIRICNPKVLAPGTGIEQFAHGSTYNKAHFRFLIALWIARRHRPHAIVSDPELLQLFRMLYAKVEVPSPSTVSRDIREIFLMSRANVAAQLQAHVGRLHLCIDGWTSPNVISFLGVTVHYMDTEATEGAQMRSFILDFVRLLHNHTGKYLAKQLSQCLREYGIEKKILGITADNASNNDTLIIEMESLGGANSSQTRVRCFAHIINLVVKAILSLFVTKRSKTPTNGAEDANPGDEEDDLNAKDDLDEAPEDGEQDGDEDPDGMPGQDEDEYEEDPGREADDLRLVEAAVAEAGEDEDMLGSDEQLIARHAVSKLTQLAKRVFHSPSIRHDLKTQCESCGITPKQMIRTVATRWNSTSDAIARALELRLAINKLLALSKYDQPGKKGLRRFKLFDPEWVILERIHPLLQKFVLATKIISKTNTPLIHQVIPVIDILTENLQQTIDDRSLPKMVRRAAKRGLTVLNKYYSATDQSVMYRIAMLLHPRYKAEYFRRQQWEPAWIATALELLREQWTTYYKPKPAVAVNRASSQASTATTSVEDTTMEDLFFKRPDAATSVSVDALEEYLASPTLPSINDPLPFWGSQLTATTGQYGLARMALDFLSAPASSTDVERAFSRGSLTVTKRRHALNDESVRSAAVIGSWAGLKNAIPEVEIVKMFSDKSKRAKTSNVYEEGDGAANAIEID